MITLTRGQEESLKKAVLRAIERYTDAIVDAGKVDRAEAKRLIEERLDSMISALYKAGENFIDFSVSASEVGNTLARLVIFSLSSELGTSAGIEQVSLDVFRPEFAKALTPEALTEIGLANITRPEPVVVQPKTPEEPKTPEPPKEEPKEEIPVTEEPPPEETAVKEEPKETPPEAPVDPVVPEPKTWEQQIEEALERLGIKVEDMKPLVDFITGLAIGSGVSVEQIKEMAINEAVLYLKVGEGAAREYVEKFFNALGVGEFFPTAEDALDAWRNFADSLLKVEVQKGLTPGEVSRVVTQIIDEFFSGADPNKRAEVRKAVMDQFTELQEPMVSPGVLQDMVDDIVRYVRELAVKPVEEIPDLYEVSVDDWGEWLAATASDLLHDMHTGALSLGSHRDYVETGLLAGEELIRAWAASGQRLPSVAIAQAYARETMRAAMEAKIAEDRASKSMLELRAAVSSQMKAWWSELFTKVRGNAEATTQLETLMAQAERTAEEYILKNPGATGGRVTATIVAEALRPVAGLADNIVREALSTPKPETLTPERIEEARSLIPGIIEQQDGHRLFPLIQSRGLNKDLVMRKFVDAVVVQLMRTTGSTGDLYNAISAAYAIVLATQQEEILK